MYRSKSRDLTIVRGNLTVLPKTSPKGNFMRRVRFSSPNFKKDGSTRRTHADASSIFEYARPRGIFDSHLLMTLDFKHRIVSNLQSTLKSDSSHEIPLVKF